MRFYINKTMAWTTVFSLIINLIIPAGALFAADAESALPSIEIISDVEGATVYLRGEVVGVTPLSEAIQVDGVFYNIRVEKEGYSPWQQRGIVAPRGEVLTLRPVMISIEDSELLEEIEDVPIAPSKITLSTAIKGATVYLNGKIIGTTPLLETTEFKPGMYTVELRKQGYSSWKKEVMVIEGETLVLKPLMVPLSKAEIEAESKPPIVEKKPFYKKWWYWTLVLAAVGATIGSSDSSSAGGGDGSAAGTW